MHRIFTAEDQLSFAEVSGDYNPIHVDSVAARRLLFGRPVVHGIHALMWAIDTVFAQQFASRAQPMRIRMLTVHFLNPAIVGEPVDLSIKSSDNGALDFQWSSSGVKLASVNLALEPASTSSRRQSVAASFPEKQPCHEPSVDEAKVAAGRLQLFLDPASSAKLFPNASQLLSQEQLATLLVTTRLVGMVMPGLHSLYLGLTLSESNAVTEPEFAYEVEPSDPRFPMLVRLRIKAPGLSGKITAAFRPKPIGQASMAELRRLVDPGEFAGVRALVIGGSRGLGELAVKQLAAGGAEMRLTYHRGAADAQRVVDDVISGGGKAASFAYNVLTDAARLGELLDGWQPTLLCYFATPFIASGIGGRFSPDLFRTFCSYYVDGLLAAFNALRQSGSLTSVLYPSSVSVEEPSPKMAEYAAAKAASEAMCAFLASSDERVRVHCRRLPKLATDQTASLFGSDAADPQPVLLDILRSIRAKEVSNGRAAH